jgi:hypothetical protein
VFKLTAPRESSTANIPPQSRLRTTFWSRNEVFVDFTVLEIYKILQLAGRVEPTHHRVGFTMARSTLPPSSQQNAGLIPPYRPPASSTISSTWLDSKYHNSLSSEPSRSRGRDRSNMPTQSPSSTKHGNSFSSPNPVSLTASTVNMGSSHGKLHKKSGSTSTTPNLKSSESDNATGDFEADLTHQAPSRLQEPYTNSPSSSSVEKSKAKGGIKPLLRKFTPQESNSLDLSRSAAENEGLGIYTSVDRDRRTAESNSSSIDRRGPFHHRSTSGTSQFSTATTSSGHKPGSQYVHPMRQTPRPYTPPASIIGSEYSGEPARVASESEHSQAPALGERTTSFNSSQTPQSGLRLHTGSLTRLATTSQTNLAGTPTSFRGAADAMSMADTISPISRSSIDRGFRMRGRTNTDPVTRAASIQAARRAFEEKEAAKTRKIEKQQLKALDRETRKRDKQDEHIHRSESRENTKYDDLATNEPADSIRGIDYGTLPSEEKTDPEYPATKPGLGPRVKGTKSTWVLFLTWLRTRIFKLKRKVSHNNEH